MKVILVLLLGVGLQAQTIPPGWTCDSSGCSPTATPTDVQLLQAINTTVAALLAAEKQSLAAQQAIQTAVTSSSSALKTFTMDVLKFVLPSAATLVATLKATGKI